MTMAMFMCDTDGYQPQAQRSLRGCLLTLTCFQLLYTPHTTPQGYTFVMQSPIFPMTDLYWRNGVAGYEAWATQFKQMHPLGAAIVNQSRACEWPAVCPPRSRRPLPNALTSTLRGSHRSRGERHVGVWCVP
jgi:hypothetical protein